MKENNSMAKMQVMTEKCAEYSKCIWCGANHTDHIYLINSLELTSQERGQWILLAS